MKFICDQMLAKLGKWLRAAGYDTIIIDHPLPDSEILNIGQKEDRIVLSRDHFFAHVAGAVWLESNLLEDCVQELNKKLQLNWLLNPFSRCLDCNTELVETEAKKFWYCPHCQKKFWRGSHTDHMEHTLKLWAGKSKS